MLKKISKYTLIVCFSVNYFNAVAESESENISGSGVGYGETKYAACEVALNNARGEASQAAYTLVQSKFESMESDSGVAYKQNNQLTSKSYVRLLDKEETTTYIQESGQIKCNLTALFKTIPLPLVKKPMAKNMNSNIDSDVDNVNLVEPKIQMNLQLISGIPFCLKYLGNACFREYFDPKSDQWGVQYLGIANGGQGGFSLTLGKLGLITSIGGKKVSTKEAFMDWYLSEVDLLKKPSVLFSKGKGLKWNKNGYDSKPSDTYIQGLGKHQVSFFTRNKEVNKDNLLVIDNILQESLMNIK